MASPSQIRAALTLEEFLLLPEIDDHPYLEFVDGRIEAKVSPQKKHGVIQKRLMTHLDGFSQPRGLGETFPELRCTFAGRSIVPDVVFLTEDHIQADSQGDLINETFQPPDIHIEIASPDQRAKRNRDRLQFSTANGCLMGCLIDPERKVVEVFLPGGSHQPLPNDGVLEGDPVLPGYRQLVSELFDWLKFRGTKPSGSETPDPGASSS
jgi:Uma2 family endonuclease